MSSMSHLFLFSQEKRVSWTQKHSGCGQTLSSVCVCVCGGFVQSPPWIRGGCYSGNWN